MLTFKIYCFYNNKINLSIFYSHYNWMHAHAISSNYCTYVSNRQLCINSISAVCQGHFLAGALRSGEVFLWHKETDTLRLTAPLEAIKQEADKLGKVHKFQGQRQ